MNRPRGVGSHGSLGELKEVPRYSIVCEGGSEWIQEELGRRGMAAQHLLSWWFEGVVPGPVGTSNISITWTLSEMQNLGSRPRPSLSEILRARP